jgi:hypothetical protein
MGVVVVVVVVIDAVRPVVVYVIEVGAVAVEHLRLDVDGCGVSLSKATS